MEKPNKKGAKFARLTAGRGVKARIAAELGVNLPVVNNWKARGVPKEYAHAVAIYLGCKPHEISDVYPVEQPVKSGDVQARVDRLSPERQKELNSFLDFLLEKQRAQGD
jgi:hypothetical protein